jgi:ABC-type polysaccharide/polyol phosphate export permease
MPGGPDRWMVNEAPNGRARLRPRELWDHRGLVLFFAQRDVKVRYKQAFLGAAWAGVQPLLGALAFTVLFRRITTIDVGDRSYFAFALVGFAVWTYLSAAIANGSTSLLYNANLLTKVAFPRVVIPTAALALPLLDFGVAAALALAAAVVAGDGFSPVGFVVGLPAGLGLLAAGAFGPALFTSSLVAKYRDASVLVTFGLQLLLFASPIAYPPELVRPAWRTILYLNPATGAAGLLRAALTNRPLPPAGPVALSAAVALAVAAIGLRRFRLGERELADII